VLVSCILASALSGRLLPSCCRHEVCTKCCGIWASYHFGGHLAFGLHRTLYGFRVVVAHRAFTVCRSPLAQAFMSHSLDSNPDLGSSCFYSLQVTLGTSFHELLQFAGHIWHDSLVKACLECSTLANEMIGMCRDTQQQVQHVD
jgi:hypothetical protein